MLISDTSLLIWKDEVIEYVMFLDYYFQDRPFDLGERSRHAQARDTFNMISQLSNGKYAPQEIYATNFTFEILDRAPRGKKMLIPETIATNEVTRINSILKANPSIETIYVLGMQVNYLLQKYGFCQADQNFITAASPRNKGLANTPPFYQPIAGDAFTAICGLQFHVTQFPDVTLIPILPLSEYNAPETL